MRADCFRAHNEVFAPPIRTPSAFCLNNSSAPDAHSHTRSTCEDASAGRSRPAPAVGPQVAVGIAATLALGHFELPLLHVVDHGVWHAVA